MMKQEIRVPPGERALDSKVPSNVPRALADAFSLFGARLNVERNAEIYGEAEQAEFAYIVVSGVVRTHKLLTDGTGASGKTTLFQISDERVSDSEWREP